MIAMYLLDKNYFLNDEDTDDVDEEDEIVAFHPIHNIVSEASEIRCEVAYRNAFTVTFSEERREVSNVELNDSLYSFKYE